MHRGEEAEARLQEALTLFTAVLAPFEVARTHLALAQLAHRRGDITGTTQHLDEAYRLFRALAVSRYLERAERRAADFGVSLPKTGVSAARARPRHRPGRRAAS